MNNETPAMEQPEMNVEMNPEMAEQQVEQPQQPYSIYRDADPVSFLLKGMAPAIEGAAGRLERAACDRFGEEALQDPGLVLRSLTSVMTTASTYAVTELSGVRYGSYLNPSIMALSVMEGLIQSMQSMEFPKESNADLFKAVTAINNAIAALTPPPVAQPEPEAQEPAEKEPAEKKNKTARPRLNRAQQKPNKEK